MLQGGIVMRIACRGVKEGGPVKSNIAASGKGSVSVAKSVVLVRCIIAIWDLSVKVEVDSEVEVEV